MKKNEIKNKSSNATKKWQETQLILLTRNEPHKAAVAGCCPNFSLTDSKCRQPIRS